MKKEISKEDAALNQLEDAVRLFKEKRYESAITLSGSAEEILAQLLILHSKKTQIPISTAEELEADMFDLFSDILKVENYHNYRSKIRNELKHHDFWSDPTIKGNFRQISLTHIAGAISNYRLVHHQYPQRKIIIDFCEEIGI